MVQEENQNNTNENGAESVRVKTFTLKQDKSYMELTKPSPGLLENGKYLFKFYPSYILNISLTIYTNAIIMLN